VSKPTLEEKDFDRFESAIPGYIATKQTSKVWYFTGVVFAFCISQYKK
jgi:hypothetical protein